jgi:hypothetical protein
MKADAVSFDRLVFVFRGFAWREEPDLCQQAVSSTFKPEVQVTVQELAIAM